MIIITGANGIVGRAVYDLLHKEKHDVIPIVHHRRNGTPSDARVLDLTKENSLNELADDDIDGVVHLAAAVPHSSRYPDTEESARLTRSIDRNVLSFCKSIDCPVIYMSTCGLYDRSSRSMKIESESSQIRIESPYFSAKYHGEEIFSKEALSIILRLAAPIGPGQKASVVLSRFILAARANTPIQIWGTGNREQNFVDVRDVARLIHLALLSPKACLINVAGKQPITMLELAKSVIRVVNGGEITFSSKVDPKEGETARYSIRNAFNLYNWTPLYSLDESIRSIVDEEFEQ